MANVQRSSGGRDYEIQLENEYYLDIERAIPFKKVSSDTWESHCFHIEKRTMEHDGSASLIYIS